MKKIISMALALAMTTALLAGCSGNAPAAEAPKTEAPAQEAAQENAAPAEKTALKFAAQGDSTPGTQALIDAYNASQDKYIVEWVDMTNDSGAMREQLITTLKAGSSDYDVISLDVVWAGEFAASGYIAPLDQLMKQDGLRLPEFNAGSMASGSYNGKQYVLPFFPDLGLLYFRKDIVSADDAAKLVSGDYTFADLQAMAETYKGQGGTTDGFVYQSGQYEGLVCNATEFTKGWTDIKGGLEAMKAMTDSEGTPKDILNYTEGETANSFIKGASVFARNWPYQWASIANEGTIKTDVVDVAPLPGGSTVGGWLLAINKNSASMDGAWDFLKFAATAEGQLQMATKGSYLPGFNALLSDSEVLAGNEMLNMTGFQNALNTTIARPVSPEYSKMSDILQQEIHKYLSGAQELDATVTAVEAAIAG